MKVRITRMYFDGLKRHREGSVLNIKDTKYTKASEIPKTSKKKVGDYIHFAPSCMEIVDAKTTVVDVPRPIPGLTVTSRKSVAEETAETQGDSEETSESGGEGRLSDSQAI